MEKGQNGQNKKDGKRKGEERPESKAGGKPRTKNRKLRDSAAKVILREHELMAQFLRDYGELDIFKGISAEDIEDVTETFTSVTGEETAADIVRIVKVPELEGKWREEQKEAALQDRKTKKKKQDPKGKRKTIEEGRFCLVILIEHKSENAADIYMQLLKYIVSIWERYRKEAKEKGYGHPDRAGFRYPPVLPVVYYDGVQEWTAPRRLLDRVFMGDIFAGYIPEFKYLLVDLRRKAEQEYFDNGDIISFLMLLQRLRSVEEFEYVFKRIPDSMLENLDKSPENIRDIINEGELLRKMGVEEERIEEISSQIRERKGYHMFEHFQTPEVGVSEAIRGYRQLSEEKKQWQQRESSWQQKESSWQQKESSWQLERSDWQKKEEEYKRKLAALEAQLAK